MPLGNLLLWSRILYSQGLTCQSTTSRDVANCSGSVSAIDVASHNSRNHSLKGGVYYERHADLHFFTRPTGSYTPTRSEIKFLSGQCDRQFFNGAEKPERGDDLSRSICIMLLLRDCSLLPFCALLPIVARDDIALYTGYL